MQNREQREKGRKKERKEERKKVKGKRREKEEGDGRRPGAAAHAQVKRGVILVKRGRSRVHRS